MRTGCIHYSATMINKLLDRDPEVYIPSNSSGLFPSNAKLFPTYFGPVSFIIHSLIAIPLIFIFVLIKRIKHGKSTAFYFTAFHPWNYLLIRYGKWLGIKSTLTIHDFKAHTGESSAVLNYLQNKSIELSDKLIFLSQDQLHLAIKKDDSLSSKSIMIPHPLLIWPGLKVNTLSYNSKPSLLMLGRINAYKGLDLFLKSIEGIRDQFGKITIAGKIQSNIKHQKKEDLLYHDKYLSEVEIAKLISEHHIIVLPYLDATQSGIIPLGIESETVMLATNVGGLTEQLPDGYPALVEASGEAIRAGLVSLLSQNIYEDCKNQLKEFKAEYESRFEQNFQNLF